MSSSIRVPCPTCRDESKLVSRGSPHFPFCSRDCRDRDLSSWVKEKYRIPGRKAGEGDAEGEVEGGDP